MYGQTELSTLLHDASIEALLTDPDYIWNDTVQPDNGPDVTAINYYRIGPVFPEDWLDVSYSINCRAPSSVEAEELARTVRDVVNRHSSGSVFFTISVLAVISPSDMAGDNYNAPVECTAKGRNV